ncbi:hypothetical protein Tco_0528996 [Tanacetum coccineum]
MKLIVDDEGTSNNRRRRLKKTKMIKPNSKKDWNGEKQIARKGFHSDMIRDDLSELDRDCHEEKCMIEPEDDVKSLQCLYFANMREIILCLLDVCKAMLDKKLQGEKPDVIVINFE